MTLRPGRRARIFCRHQGAVCPLCGVLFKRRADGVPEDYTFDHVWPKSRGGYAYMGNLLIAHSACNHRKGNRLPTGCEIIWLSAVCERLKIPMRPKPEISWVPPPLTTIHSDGHRV